MPHPADLLKWHCRLEVEVPLRYARRMATMGPREIAARLRDHSAANRPLRAPAWNPPDRASLAERLENQFLFGPDRARAIAESWRAARPREAARLIDSARLGLQDWKIFGLAVKLDPERLDWLAVPDAARYDRRWVWELNRHQFLFTFARAFVLTGEAGYARRICDLLESWRRANPAAEGVNWSSALEVGVRAISWLWTLPLLLGWPGLEDRRLAAWLGSLHEHYQYLKDHLSLYTDPTNHLIGEAAALWLLAAALPELPEAAGQQERAAYLLGREAQRQITADGVSLEQSTGYHRFVLDFYLQVMAVARRARRPLPAVFGQRVGAMLDFVAALAGESGEVPAIGDSDDARGMPLPELSGWDFSDLLTSGAVLQNFDPPAKPAPDSAVWLAGPEALSEPPGSRSIVAPGSKIFAEGGYCLFQGEAEGRQTALLFDVGPLGLWPNASHGHADALSVNVKLGGRWILGDPGTGAYTAQGKIRDSFRGTAAHNTVLVDGLNQSDSLDIFKWLKPVPVRVLDLCTSPDYDYALACHQGYHRLRDPVAHYRAVLFVRPPAPQPAWILADRLEGEGHHRCVLHFHFPPAVDVRATGAQAAVARDPRTGAKLLLLFSDAPTGEPPVFRIHTEELWSSRFGQWEPAPVISVERNGRLPIAWFTFLVPLAGEAAPKESLETVWSGDTVACRRVSAGGEETAEWSLRGSEHAFRYRRQGIRSQESGVRSQNDSATFSR